MMGGVCKEDFNVLLSAIDKPIKIKDAENNIVIKRLVYKGLLNYLRKGEGQFVRQADKSLVIVKGPGWLCTPAGKAIVKLHQSAKAVEAVKSVETKSTKTTKKKKP